MILIVLIGAVLGFAVSGIFIKSKRYRYLFGAVALLLVGLCEGSIILNDRFDFGMQQDIQTSSIPIDSALENEDILLYQEDDGQRIYFYKQKNHTKIYRTLPNEKVTILRGEGLPTYKKMSTVLSYKNRAYRLLFLWLRPDHEILKVRGTFQLPDSWIISEQTK